VLEVANAFGTVLQRPLPTKPMPRRAGDPPALACNSSKLKRELGWTPNHASIESIVSTALAWEKKLSASKTA
jgi:UDP-glucose 4-epimerase